MSYVVPAELVLNIISLLDTRSEKSTLASCSLLCSTFRFDAQKRLFASVKLVADLQWDPRHLFIQAEASSRSKSFLEAITQSPHLASFVRKLELQVSDTLHSRHGVTFEHSLLRRGVNYMSTVDNSQQLVGILRQLRRLHSFSVTGIRAVNWHHLDIDLKRAILKMIRLNPLRRISIAKFDDFRIGSFYKSSQLQHLTLYDMSPEEALESQLRDTKPCSIRLLSLTLDTELNGHNVMERLLTFTGNPLCPITLSKLGHLSIYSDSIIHVPQLLLRCASSLTHLSFSIPRNAMYYSKPTHPLAAICPLLDLQSLHQLRRLTIMKCRIHSTYQTPRYNSSNTTNANYIEETMSSIPWLNTVLDTVPRSTETTNRPPLQIDIQLFFTNVSSHNIQTSVPWDALMNPLLDLRHHHRIGHRLHITNKTELASLKPPNPADFQATIKALKANPLFGHLQTVAPSKYTMASV